MISPRRAYTSSYTSGAARWPRRRRCFYCCAVCVYSNISVDTVVLVYTRSLPICENFKVVFSLHRLFGGHTTHNCKRGLFCWARVRILNVYFCFVCVHFLHMVYMRAYVWLRCARLLRVAIVVTHMLYIYIYRRSSKWPCSY